MDGHYVFSREQEFLKPETVLRITETKINGQIHSYAMTVARFIDIANKNHFAGFAHFFAMKAQTLEQRLTDAIQVHEELNRCDIVCTREI
jgi:SUMO ligase MMS21 Smc5/6 complex component